jgi:CelD/BcsL family acetyltransferase involved in cellulose biosynthesis
MLSKARNRLNAPQADLPLSIELITDAAAFESLQTDWDELVGSMECPEIFYCWEWNDVFRRHFRKNDRLLVMLVRDTARALVAIAPFCVRRTRRSGIEVKVLETIVGGISDYGNIFVRKGIHRGKAVSAILEFLRDRRGLWDVIDLWDFCTRDSTTLHVLNLAPACPEWSVRTHVSTPVAARTLGTPSHAEDRQRIHRVRNRMKKLEGRGLRIQVGLEDFASYWPIYCDIHRKAWPDSSFAWPDKQSFYDELCARERMKGRVELSIAELDGRPAAMHFGFVDSRKVYFYMPAVDPDFRKDGVGAVLLYAMMERYRKTHEVFDFLRGVQPYKLWYTDALDLNLRLVIYRSASLAAFAYNLGGVTKRYGVELGLPKAAVQLAKRWAAKIRRRS